MAIEWIIKYWFHGKRCCLFIPIECVQEIIDKYPDLTEYLEVKNLKYDPDEEICFYKPVDYEKYYKKV